jgi:hypothetical protein
MEAFLNGNVTAMQNWVSDGGSLFLNAAPNEGDGMSFGFGVNPVYPSGSSTATAVDPLHPIFQGPFGPVATSYTGSSFGHAVDLNGATTAIMVNESNGSVLAEKDYGLGHVIFGGLATDNFHSPQPQTANLTANILS